MIGGYFVLTITYSLWLKHEPVLDLAAVACGFVLRAIAGGIAVGVPISPWFLIVAGAGSLFMVTGKRSAELRQLGAGAISHRRSLAGYTEGFLSYVRGVASSVAILAYCLWAFEKSATVGEQAWFELSIVPFALGVLRYALLLSQGDGGAPEELVLSDRVLLGIGVVWVGVLRGRGARWLTHARGRAQRGPHRLGPHRAEPRATCGSRAAPSDVVELVASRARRRHARRRRARARPQLRRRRAERRRRRRALHRGSTASSSSTSPREPARSRRA